MINLSYFYQKTYPMPTYFLKIVLPQQLLLLLRKLCWCSDTVVTRGYLVV